MPDIAAIREKMFRAVDRVFAQTLDHFPQKNGAADAGRAKTDFTGVLRVGTAKSDNIPGRSWGSRIAAGEAVLHIDRAQNPGITFKTGDRIRANGIPGTPFFEVLRVDDRDEGRLQMSLGEV